MTFLTKGVSPEKSEKQRGKNSRKDRGGQDIYPEGQGAGGPFAHGKIFTAAGACSLRGIAADRAASLKEIFFSGEAAFGTADRREISPAFGAVLRVQGDFGTAALAEKTGAFGAAFFMI